MIQKTLTILRFLTITSSNSKDLIKYQIGNDSLKAAVQYY